MILLAAMVLSIVTAQPDLHMDVSRGREQYQLIKTQASLPKFGPCWKKALGALESGCRDLSEDTQHKLAFTFMNCFLKKAGRQELKCDEDNCGGDMDQGSLQIYNDYFIHTNNMCSFLQLQIWNEQTTGTIDRLTSSSHLVAEQLSESSQITQQMLEQQENSLKNQRALSDAIAHSFEDYRRTTQQQQLMLGEVFDKITNLQTVVVGEFAGFYSLLYHAFFILISYLLTSTPRTKGARFWLFALSLINIGIERLIIHWHTDSTSFDYDAVYANFWITRKIFWLASLMILVKCALDYKDLNVINNNLLLEIKRKVESRRFVKMGDSVLEYNQSMNYTVSPADTINNNTTIDCNDTQNGEFADSTLPSLDRTYLVSQAEPTMQDSVFHGDTTIHEGESMFDITQEVTRTRYCLRRRTESPSWNPILSEESPDDFMKMVKRMTKMRKSP